MAFKEFQVEGLGPVTIYKRKASRSLRLSVTSHGVIRVSIPSWSPYAAGVAFAQSRKEWIEAQRPVTHVLHHQQPVGKAHHLVFIPSTEVSKPSARVKQTEIIVRYPLNLQSDDPAVQQVAKRACVRALRAQAEQLLPRRLRQLAAAHDLSFKSVSVKQLKSRWGSCDQRKNIVLNLYLMQLPWECIDYVLLHELTHTHIMQHGKPFWAAMDKIVPNLTAIRRQMRSYQPILAS